MKANDVVLFMKGTPQFPQCGFSGQVVQILDHLGVAYKGLNVLEIRRPAQRHQDLFQLADHPAALREGRVRRRLRHRPRDVPGRRAAEPCCKEKGVAVGDEGRTALRRDRSRYRLHASNHSKIVRPPREARRPLIDVCNKSGDAALFLKTADQRE